MIGRFNSWKGQPLLIKALATLPKQSQDRLEIVFVGNCFRGQEAYLSDAKKLCTDLNLQCEYHFYDFSNYAGDFFEWGDIVVIPSTKPEPFGLVSIEGMAYSNPIIAANHGGLAEVVLHEETGIKFEPNNHKDLAKAIEHYLQHPQDISRHGTIGHKRFQELYTIDVYSKNFIEAVERNIQRA